MELHDVASAASTAEGSFGSLPSKRRISTTSCIHDNTLSSVFVANAWTTGRHLPLLAAFPPQVATAKNMCRPSLAHHCLPRGLLHSHGLSIKIRPGPDSVIFIAAAGGVAAAR